MFLSPIIVAPMAGGPSTPELVIAAAQAGALGFLAAGYKTAATLADQITEVRAKTEHFGVNLFVSDGRPAEPAALAAYRETLLPEAERYGVELPALRATADDDDWQSKIELLLASPVSVVSFAFGLPQAAEIHDLRSRGTATGATVTSAEEAQAAAECGVDFLVVQHPHAGGHSGAFLDLARFDREQPTGPGSMAELLGSISQISKLPMVAAGGLGSKAAIAAALQSGAVSAQLGTAFLCADEAGTKPVHRAALMGQEFTNTVRTRAFSGRWARGLENRFMRDHADAPEGYPQIHHLTSPLRAAAAATGDPQGVNLWAGTEFASVQSGSTASILARLLD